jgi:alanine racemase
MLRRTHLRIDTSALRHNLNLLKKWNGPAFFCPMVKANAYGHGSDLVAHVVEDNGCSALGVALVEEGVALRASGIKTDILTFAPLSMEGAQVALKNAITPVLGRFEDLIALDRARIDGTVKAHLKFNTGMQRLGFDLGDLTKLKSELKARPWLSVEGLCTHFTHGEDAALEDGPTRSQLARFDQMTAGFPGFKHAHKSASLAVLEGKELQPALGSRPGIGIYGLPHDGRALGKDLRPALTWVTELIHLHTVEKGESASYSGRWTAQRRSVIGVVPMGYGDGYMRALSNKGAMLCRGRRVPVVGSVCMDYTLLDLTDVGAELKAGEPIVVLGRQANEEISAADIAEWAGTIAYEVVTNISARIPREAV